MPATDCSPERLMRLVREGSADALDQITRCYSERLLAAGRRHCRSASEAEDAVQDALIAAADHLVDVERDASLEGYLVRVVASACRRIGRGRKNAAQLHDSDVELLGQDDPEDAATRRELAQLLDRTLLELPADDRSILLLAELEDFSAQQIAEELNLSEGAVRTRLSRLRRRVAAALREKSDVEL